MPWPTDQDYNEAVQNPAVAFSDQELKGGRVELNSMCLPKARSGNFATIYRVETSTGAYAIRCFRYDNPEQSLRYPAIASYLDQNLLPYMVSFRFMSQGIRVGPNWYPTVKMKWVEGEGLVSYIQRNLSSEATLKRLAAHWVQMLADLHRIKIAHGDLQHGNVLVVQGKLKLVDYDGMFVPALEGTSGLELGHRNYQHPQRTEMDFGPNVDNFSAWLIYLSLMALAIEPKLWNQLNAGDECLLFRREDFDAPEQSAAFRLLRALPDKQIGNLTDQIEHFLWLPPNQIPLISDSFIESQPNFRTASPNAMGGSWINDYIHTSVKSFDDNEFAVDEAGDPTWIQDHVENTSNPGSFVNSAKTDRLISAFICLALFSLCAWISLGVPTAFPVAWMMGILAGSSITAVCWYIRYKVDPIFEEVRAARSEMNRADRETETAKGASALLKAKRLQRRNVYVAGVSDLQKRLAGLRPEEATRLGSIDDAMRSTIQQINVPRRTVAANEADENRKLLGGIATQISELSKVLLSLPSQEQQELRRLESQIGTKVDLLVSNVQQLKSRRDAELAGALKSCQDQVVESHLRKVKLSTATIPGIGSQLKARLAAAGYISAADIGARYGHVPGIGSSKAAAIIAWRQQVESPIRVREAPKSLPPNQIASIEQRYESQIRQVEQSLAHERAQLIASKQSLKTWMIQQKQSLEAQKAALEETMRFQNLAIEKRFEDERKKLADHEQDTRKQHQQCTDNCRKQFQATAADLTQQSEGLRKDYNASLEVLNAEVQRLTSIVRNASWRREQVARRYRSYASLTFGRYVRRALGRV